jgi:hypothetical protein
LSAFAAEHRAARDDIAAFALGGDLPAAAAEHLTRCPRCAQDLAAYRSLAEAARTATGSGIAAELPPASIWQRIADGTGVGGDALPDRAVLRPEPQASGASGIARLRAHDTGQLLTVDASGLPQADGYYAVWLCDRREQDLVAMGALGATQRGVWTVPAGLDLGHYRVVLVTSQRYGGAPAPGTVVLRGALGAAA